MLLRTAQYFNDRQLQLTHEFPKSIKLLRHYIKLLSENPSATYHASLNTYTTHILNYPVRSQAFFYLIHISSIAKKEKTNINYEKIHYFQLLIYIISVNQIKCIGKSFFLLVFFFFKTNRIFFWGKSLFIESIFL